MGMFDEFEAQPAKPKRPGLFDEFDDGRYSAPVQPASQPPQDQYRAKINAEREAFEDAGGGVLPMVGRGFYGLKGLWDMAAMGLEKAVTGETADTAPYLANTLNTLNAGKGDPIAGAIAESWNADGASGVARTLADNPQGLLNFMAEMLPGAVAGGAPGGVGAKLIADEAVKRVVLPQVVAKGAPIAAAGAGANAGATLVGGITPNVAGAYEENNGDLANALRQGGKQTAAESAVAAPFGAVLPFGGARVLPTAGKALVVSPVDEMTQTVAGNAAIGKDTSSGELVASGLLGATSSPVDIATATWAARQGAQAGRSAPQTAPAQPAEPQQQPAPQRGGMFDEFEADATADPMNPQSQPGAVVETARPTPRAVVETPAPRAIVEIPPPHGVIETPAPRALIETARGATDGLPGQDVAEVAQQGGEAGGNITPERLPADVVQQPGNGMDTVAGEPGAGTVAGDAVADEQLRGLTEGLIRQMRDAKQLNLDNTLRRAIDRIKAGGVDEKPAYFSKLAKEFERRGDAKTAGMLNQVAATLTKPKAPRPSRLTPIEDGRLTQSDFRDNLPRYVEGAGWAEIGGRLIRGNDGEAAGRTAWVPKADWWLGKPEGVTESILKTAAPKALAGQPMTAAEKNSVKWLLDVMEKDLTADVSPEGASIAQEIADDLDIDLDAVGVTDTAEQMRSLGFTEDEINEATQGRAQAAGETAEGRAAEGDRVGEGQAPQEVFGLQQQTEADLTQREAEIARREAEVAKREQEAEQKAKADRERDGFTLTGSDRAADVNPAQRDLLAAPNEEARNDSPVAESQAPDAESGDAGVAPGRAAVSPQQKDAAPITDLGEKIGGARKDTAEKTGPRGDKAAAATAEDVPTWRKRFTIAEQLPKTGEYVDPDAPKKYVIFDTRTKKPLRGQGYRPVEFASIEAAEKAVPLYAVAMKHRVTLTSRSNETPAYEIWRDVTERKRVKVVDQQFASRDDAMRYMAEHAAEILATKTGFGEEILAVPEKVMRRGKERRSGPVDGQNFMDAFGFRGVEFGNWNNQAERQEVMNHAYDALLDLAEVIGVPPKALSLNGDLGLAFGARGQGLSGAKAHYETDYGVINLTKMSGAGSLAHEWFHAADHYFGRQDGKAKATREADKHGNKVYDSKGAADMASHGFKVNNSGVREEVRAAYTKLIQTMFRKAEQYVEDTQQADKFVADARGRLEAELKKIRDHLAAGPDTLTYMKRNNKPASAEQLAEFDRLADALIEGQDLDTRFIYPDGGNKRNALSGGRWSNDTLEAMSGILKAVRGRQGFNSEKSGWLDGLRYLMQAYGQRIAMLESARNADVKTKQVPTSYAMEAKKIDQGRVTDYWTTEHEMAARAFSAYVEDKIAADNGKSDFLAFGSNNDMMAYRLFNVRPFPEGAERVAINQAFDEFFGVLQTRETDSGIALFARGRSESAGGAGPVSQVELDAVIERVASGWKRAQGDGGRLIAVDTVDALPVAILRAADAQNVPQQEIKGVFHRGHIYLVRENHANALEVEETIFHEAYGHMGALLLNGNDQQKLNASFNDVWSRIGALDGVRKMAGQFDVLDQVEPYIKSLATADMPLETKRRVIVDELLAHVQGRGDFTWKEQAKAYIGALRVALRNAARAMKLDGIAQTLDGYTDGELLWNLKQMRAAVVSGKIGKGSGTLFARRAPAGPNSPQQPLRLQPGKGFNVDPETAVEAVQRRHQDKMNRWAKVQRQIKEQGGTVELDQDVYHAMERMTGRAADRIDQFTHDTVRPLLKRVAELKTNLEEVGTYLMALGAKDRNAYIHTIRQDMPNNGSGLSNQEAAQIIADYAKRPDFAAFDALARDFQALTERKLKVLVGGGVITQQQAADMRRAFGFYVPYKGFETIDEEGNRTGGTGAGYSTPKRFSKQAFGRVSKAGQAVENIIRDYEQAVILAEKANVGRYARNLAQANPDPTLWTVDMPQQKPSLVNGQVQMRQAMFDNENEIRFIDNGQEVRIQLHDKLLAQTYNNLGQEQMALILKAGDALNRVLRQTYTQKNPAFIFVNAMRDIQTGLAVMTGEMGAAKAIKALRHAPGAWKAVGMEVWERGSVKGEWAKYLDAYRKSGAQTAYYAIEDIEAKQAKLQELLAREGGQSFLNQWRQHGGGLKGAKATAKLAAWRTYNNRLVDVIESLNGGFENMMRLAAFRQYIDDHGGLNGASRETLAEASRIAKNLTVNFNRKGEKTRGMNALYLFWNASVQGTQNVYRAATQSTHNKQVKAILGGMVGLGFLMSMTTDDEDDDLTPDYLKGTSIVIHIGDGQRIQVPLAYGLGYFVALGYELGSLVRDRQTPIRTAMNILGAALTHFSPLGNPIHDGDVEVKDVVVAATPTVLKPAVMSATNRNQMGYDIVPKWDEDSPDRDAMYAKTRGGVYDEAAGLLDAVGFDVSPESMKMVTTFITGGLGTFIGDSTSTTMVAAKGGGFDAETMPIIKRFYGVNDVEEHRSRFYELAEDVKDQARAQGKKQSEFFRGNGDSSDSVQDFTKRMKELREKEDAARKAGRDSAMKASQKQQIRLADAFKKEHDRMVKRGLIERQ